MRQTDGTTFATTSWKLAATAAALALLGGCGQALIGVGAEMAAGGASSGTRSVASGGGPGAGAAAAAVAGVALMAGGYALTPPDQRTPNPNVPPPVVPSHRQPNRR